MNHIIITGNIANDIELKQTQGGTSVCRFGVAVKRTYTPKEVDFLDVVAWRTNAEFVSRYFCKGKPILVSGEVQTRKWNDRTGATRYSVEIVADHVEFFGGGRDDREGQVPAEQASAAQPAVAYATAASADDFMSVDVDDTLPF